VNIGEKAIRLANSKFHDGNVTEVVKKLKEESGKDIMVMDNGRSYDARIY
jgi:hypothetical protein